ncbi:MULTISPECIES: M48 family metalloprotease [Clostridium]|uniref:M48 family metalloprotease n=1 Tax=Clostridium cibarium TaxID=2762247 RepID=A0ABR8PT47_9CLOT|nr:MULTISPECIES: M48 family metalloprotease [Clostridium]MBD7911353.1 M48 family metalloprotease [Clostridium cibarium]
MKKFLIRTMVGFALIFVILFCITMFLEYKNKSNLLEEVKIEQIVEDGKIQVPATPSKVEVNYEFSQVYFYSGILINLSIPVLFYYFGGIEVIKKANFRKKIVEGGVLCILYGALSEILIFPKILFSSFYRAKLVGLSNQSFFDFLGDFAKGIGEDLLLTLPIAVIIYLIFINKKRWYIWVSAILVAISLVSNYVYPYIDEIENDLVDMEGGGLKDKILELSKDAGIENLEIKVIPKSHKTGSMNAYMTGIHNSRRIVFWDTTLNKLSDKEILSVAAHEMGHYKLNHIQKSMIFELIGIVLLILSIHILMTKNKGKDYRKIENIPKILLIINIISILIMPIESAYSRKAEVEADEFAMRITGDNLTNGLLELRFVESNLTPVDVNGLYKWLAYDHPTVKERIENSNNFKN